MQTYTNPQSPGKTFRRLEVGEVIQEEDYANAKHQSWKSWASASSASGTFVMEGDILDFYREITTDTPLTTDQRLDIILAKLERIDAVLAGLNKEDNT